MKVSERPPNASDRRSPPEVFLEKGVLKICSKFTGEHPCRSVVSMKLQSNFTEITIRHECSPVNLLHIFRTTFLKNTVLKDGCFCSDQLLLNEEKFSFFLVFHRKAKTIDKM